MERSKGQSTVHTQDRPATRPESAAPELDGLRMGRRHRKLLGIGRLPADTMRPAGPQCLPRAVETLEDLDAPGRHRRELLVELRQFHPEHVSLGLELEPILPGNALDLPERQVLTVALPLLALGSRSRREDDVLIVAVHRAQASGS
ncbi:MAG TPA: hypothetical protein VNQ33_03840 [Acidimicrobiales bacterium]|nr:hypothetical protein [Acidimicrobiales bacterium]